MGIKPELIDKVSLRALKAHSGPESDDLWLIPVELAELDRFMLNPHNEFLRMRGGVYDFGPWKRPDGDHCEEMPGMMYAMGHTVQVRCAEGECCNPKLQTPAGA